MLHQSLIVLFAYWLMPYRLGPVLEPVLVLGATIAGCWGLFALVCRVRCLRPLFGLKLLPRPERPALLQSTQPQ